jgi:2-polyprenyl-3-methyl-5-hydroxy-6-metoxy-1,4-benzoquinol methylase
MTVQPIADLDALKTRIRATWMAGDYGSVAALTESAANEFIDRRQIKPNMRVLDVACGTGTVEPRISFAT